MAKKIYTLDDVSYIRFDPAKFYAKIKKTLQGDPENLRTFLDDWLTLLQMKMDVAPDEKKNYNQLAVSLAESQLNESLKYLNDKLEQDQTNQLLGQYTIQLKNVLKSNVIGWGEKQTQIRQLEQTQLDIFKDNPAMQAKVSEKTAAALQAVADGKEKEQPTGNPEIDRAVSKQMKLPPEEVQKIQISLHNAKAKGDFAMVGQLEKMLKDGGVI